MAAIATINLFDAKSIFNDFSDFPLTIQNEIICAKISKIKSLHQWMAIGNEEIHRVLFSIFSFAKFSFGFYSWGTLNENFKWVYNFIHKNCL